MASVDINLSGIQGNPLIISKVAQHTTVAGEPIHLWNENFKAVVIPKILKDINEMISLPLKTWTQTKCFITQKYYHIVGPISLHGRG